MKTSSDEECLGLGMTLLYDIDLREEDIDEVLQRILTERGLTLSQVHLSYWETHHEEPGIKIFKLKE